MRPVARPVGNVEREPCQHRARKPKTGTADFVTLFLREQSGIAPAFRDLRIYGEPEAEISARQGRRAFACKGIGFAGDIHCLAEFRGLLRTGDSDLQKQTGRHVAATRYRVAPSVPDYLSFMKDDAAMHVSPLGFVGSKHTPHTHAQDGRRAQSYGVSPDHRAVNATGLYCACPRT